MDFSGVMFEGQCLRIVDAPGAYVDFVLAHWFDYDATALSTAQDSGWTALQLTGTYVLSPGGAQLRAHVLGVSPSTGSLGAAVGNFAVTDVQYCPDVGTGAVAGSNDLTQVTQAISQGFAGVTAGITALPQQARTLSDDVDGQAFGAIFGFFFATIVGLYLFSKAVGMVVNAVREF